MGMKGRQQCRRRDQLYLLYAAHLAQAIAQRVQTWRRTLYQEHFQGLVVLEQDVL